MFTDGWRKSPRFGKLNADPQMVILRFGQLAENLDLRTLCRESLPVAWITVSDIQCEREGTSLVALSACWIRPMRRIIYGAEG